MKEETRKVDEASSVRMERNGTSSKEAWQEPKLNFVEPKLTQHGRLTEVTGQDSFFGGFSPTF